jgi:hypothetical protein
MIPIPPALRTRFLESVGQVVPGNLKGAYLKWLRYYWDFCHKYHFSHEHRESLPHFLKKLQEKRQTQTQQEQAAYAISLYYELLASVPTPNPSQTDSGLTGKNTPYPPQRGNSYLCLQDQLSCLQAGRLRSQGNPPLTPPRMGMLARCPRSQDNPPLAPPRRRISREGRLLLDRLRRLTLRLTTRKPDRGCPGRRSIPS